MDIRQKNGFHDIKQKISHRYKYRRRTDRLIFGGKSKIRIFT